MSSIRGITNVVRLTDSYIATEPVDAPDRSFSDYVAEAAEEPARPGAVIPEPEAEADLKEESGGGFPDEEAAEIVNEETSGAVAPATTVSGLGVEGNIRTSGEAEASGGMDNSQIVMMFMMMIMSSMAGSGSDASLIYPALMSLMSQFMDSSGSSGDAERTTETVQGWDRKYSASSWNGEIKNAAQPTVSVTGSAVVPVNAWVATSPAVVSIEGARSPDNLRAVIDQFNVESATRYTPYRNGATYCNIFVWDVTSAMGCEVPHYVDAVTGEPRTYPDVSGARELDANGVAGWLADSGAGYGWREVSEAEAQALANEGQAVVGAWKNNGGIGHVQIVCPSADGTYDASRGPAIAQAGSRNTNYTYQSNIYGAQRRQSIRYYAHA